MTRTRRFLWSAALSGGSIFVSMAALLVVGKLVTKSLPEQLVGFFALLLLWSDFVNILFSLGLTISAPKLVAAAPEDARPTLIKRLLKAQVLLILLAAALVLALHFYTPLQLILPLTYQSAVFAEYLWLLPILFVPGTLRDLAMALLAGQNRYCARSTGIVVAAGMQVALVGAVYLFGRATVENFALATASGYCCAGVWLLVALRSSFRPSPRVPVFVEAVKFSSPLYANSLLTFAYQRLDTVLVAAMIGFAGAGIYEMAKRIPGVFSRVLGAILVPYLPHLAGFIATGDTARTQILLHRALVLISAAGYLMTLAVIVIQEPLLRLLFTPEYLSAAPALGMLLAATCLGVQAGIFGQTLIALGKPKWITLVNIFTALLSLALNLLLLPRLGLVGAGIAAIVAMAFSAGLQGWLVHRHGLKLPLRPYLTLQALMLVALLASLVAYTLPAVRLSILFVFAGALPVCGVIRPKELRHLFEALRPGARA